VSAKKTVLIVTDGTESIDLIAQSLKNGMTDCKVKVCPADKFEGTDLLPAGIFFLGCEKPRPASFSYLEEMLSHINLAGRKCGIFSSSEKALKYLSGIVKDSEASLGEPLLATDITQKKVQTNTVKKWLKGILE